MAKKKSKSNLGKILGVLAAVLGIVAICMIFVETVKVPDTKILGAVVEGAGYTGLKVAFGFEESDVGVFAFSFMALLPYLLMIVGVVLSLLNATGKKGNKMLDFVSAILFVAAGVLCFLMPGFVVGADTVLGKIAEAVEYELAVGAIVSAIASIVAGVLAGVKAIKQ